MFYSYFIADGFLELFLKHNYGFLFFMVLFSVLLIAGYYILSWNVKELFL